MNRGQPSSGGGQAGGAAPGWYQPDKEAPEWRWWDGSDWTEHRHVGTDPNTVPNLLIHLTQQLTKVSNDVAFIANVMRILVALWILGFVIFVIGLLSA